MNIKLNTNLVPMFTGTYESIWELMDYDDDGNELELDYNHKDLMNGIVDQYNSNSDYIIRELNIPWIKSIKFTGHWSPREYNFNTDQLDFTLSIDKEGMIKSLKSLKNDSKFESWLRDNFTSYDGFWSSTPNNYTDLYNELVSEVGSEYDQSLGALITYLAGKKSLEDIEYMVHDDWQGNGYGGLNYKIVNEWE
jgi:hypothetical protein